MPRENATQVNGKTTAIPAPRRKRLVFRGLLALLLLIVAIPLVLKGLVGFSSVVDIRNRVDALGGRVQTATAVPEFLQSIAGKDWDGWESFYGGVEVDQILLNQTPVGDGDLDLLGETPRLRILGLQATKITDDGIRSLSSTPRLQKLDLSNTRITDAGMEHLQPLVNLQELSIAGTAVTDAGIASLTGLKNLTSLDASGTQITDAALKALAKIPALKTLILNQCRLTDAGLAELANCKSLTFLSLEGIPVTGSFLQEMKAVPLSYLNLSASRCDGASLKDSGTLNMLILDHCPVEDAGIAPIAAIPGLETLSLDNTKITEAGIPGLKDMPSLRILSINSTPVSAQALRELKDLPRLQLIKAHDTRVTRADVAALAAEIKTFVVTIASSGGG